MAFLIGGANTLDDAYEIEKSLRFNSGDSPKLQITTGSNGDREKFTFSCWFKVCQDKGANQTLISWNDGTHKPKIFIDNTSEQLEFITSTNTTDNIKTTRSFRDYSAWYHLVVAMDTTQSTDTNRMKIYVNGEQQTSLATANYMTQDLTTTVMSNTEICIGRDITDDDEPFDGYMAEIFVVDGTAYAASDFGKTNNNGVWVPIDAKDDITFGTHGFYMEFKQTGTSQNSSGIGADTSGNDNHYAVTNLAAIDVTTDTPTNNFCTWNPLYKNSGNVAYTPSSISEGNLKLTLQNDSAMLGTMGVSKGKWYWEYKLAENTSDNQDYPIIGFANNSHTASASNLVGRGTPDGDTSRGNVGSGRVSNAFDDADLSANDIIGFYLDMDNETLILHKNGSDWMGSGATSGLDFSSASYANTSDGFFYPFTQNNGLSITGDQANFGNPSFSISSSNADANGYGSFEYNPTLSSTNYYALCSKNLGEFG